MFIIKSHVWIKKIYELIYYQVLCVYPLNVCHVPVSLQTACLEMAPKTKNSKNHVLSLRRASTEHVLSRRCNNQLCCSCCVPAHIMHIVTIIRFSSISMPSFHIVVDYVSFSE